jgi:hypothetical protein
MGLLPFRFVHLDHFTIAVMAAIRAEAMGQNDFIAVRAVLNPFGGQKMVSAAGALLRF